jgi:transposase
MVTRSPNSRTNLFKAIFQFCIGIVHFQLACSMARYTTFLAESSVGMTLHLIADNYATHKHPVVQEWLARHPRVPMHFTPTSASWLNMVERFFHDITVNRLRRGVFTSVPELVAAIHKYVAHHNAKPKPFI